MKLHNLKEASDRDVEAWLIERIPEITDYQKSKLREIEMVRYSKFYFYQKRDPIKNVWLRLTVVFMPIVWLYLFLSLPFYFIATGKWGYEYEKVKWYHAWVHAVGLS